MFFNSYPIGGVSAIKKPVCTTVGVASVNGDPITTFGGVERTFSLPNFQLTTLLGTNDILVRGAAFPGEADDEQWIGQVIVESVSGRRLVDVEVRRDIYSPHRALLPAGSFKTLKVSAPDEGLLTFSTNDAETVQWGRFIFPGAPCVYPGNVTIDLLRLLDHSAASESTLQREGVLISSKSIVLCISSASALEYYWGDENKYRSLKYAHLDLEVLYAKDVTSWTGLLPEVWGVATKLPL